MFVFEDAVRQMAAYCENRIFELEKSLEKYPPGTLQFHLNGYNYTWRISYKDGPRRTLPKKKRAYARKMAKKRAIEAEIKTLKKEKEACEMYLKCCEEESELDKLWENSDFVSLLRDESGFIKADAEKWQKEEFEQCPKYPEGKVYDTLRGDKVRSKAEALIANILFTLKIPYRYEQAHIIGDRKFYPDFTVLNVRTGQEYIIEFFGMMHNSQYACSAGFKVDKYFSNGYVPFENILFFYESDKRPLDLGRIESDIRKYLM